MFWILSINAVHTLHAPMSAYTHYLLLKCHKYCELIKTSQTDQKWQETIIYMYCRKYNSSCP